MNYERFTKKGKTNGAVCFKCQKCSKTTKCDGQCEEEAVKKLWELENKIENGTLIEVLCKVGNKVYRFDNGGKIYESEIKSIHYASNALFYDCEYFVFDKSVIGEIIFLTKAEAEAKLKELKE